MVILAITIGLFSQVAVAPASGDGTSGNPYQIANWQNLYWISQSSARWNMHYIQTADIDLDLAVPAINTWDSNKGFLPIGTSANRFTGSYNGNGHKISGLYINRPTIDYSGLFGYTTATIQKLGIENAVVSGYNSTGALVGFLASGGSVTYCYAKNAIVTGTQDCAGVLIGNLQFCSVSNCYAIGSVSSYFISGGVIGWAGTGSNTFTGLYSVAVPATAQYKGSLIGWTNIRISDSRWDSSVYATGLGGSTATLTNVSGLTTAQMKSQANYPASWDFTNVWAIDPGVNDGYPYLRIFSVQAPLAATSPSPANLATGVPVTSGLSWSQGGGGAPSGYKLHFGTNTPPSNLVDGTDIGANPSYTPPAQLLYGTAYNWQVVPTNTAGDASECPTWSFTTADYYEEPLDPVIPPVGDPVNPVVTFPGLNGSFTPPDITATWAPVGAPPNSGLGVILGFGNIPYGRRIEINPDLGFVPEQLAWRIVPGSWSFVPRVLDGVDAWTTGLAWFNLPESKADDDIEIVFPQEEGQTLPVTLSSFTAVFSADLYVTLQWVTESETEHAGYNVLRNEVNSLAGAYKVNQTIINAGTANGTQVSYIFNDLDVYVATTYYYWLESVSIQGLTEYYGPISVNTTGNPEQPVPPALMNQTVLHPAYPNPFNPSVFIPYSVKDSAPVMISVYNSRGQIVRTHHAHHPKAGTYNFLWDGKNDNGSELGSGTYIIKMQCGTYSGTIKAVLLK